MFRVVNNEEFIKLAEELKIVAETRKQKTAVNLLERSVKELSTGLFSFAVLGMVKRGKSTLCNALLGAGANNDKYAPTGKTPVSNAITLFENGPRRITATFFNGSTNDISLEEIPCYITEQKNPGNCKGVSHITVRDDFPGLPEGVVLMDTPGEGSFNQHHDDLLFKYLPMVDAAVFLITAHSPIVASELEFLQQIVKNDTQKIFFAINRIDQLEDEDLRDAIEHNQKVLSEKGITVGKIYPISAKNALEGDWESSGLDNLFADISEYLSKEKYRVPRVRFINKVSAVISPMYNGVCNEIEARGKDAEELKKEIEDLTAKGSLLEETQSNHIANVKNSWTQAANKLAQEIENALSCVESQMKDYIDSIGFFSCVNAKIDFCRKFSDLVDAVMHPLFREFESEILNAIDGLPIQFTGVGFETNTQAYNDVFTSGTSYGGWKIALTTGATLISLPIGALIHLHTMSSIKSDLYRQLPFVIREMRDYFRLHIADLDRQRDDFVNELEAFFQLEMQPTVQALQDALQSQGSIDLGYDEHLAIMKNTLETLRITADNLKSKLGS